MTHPKLHVLITPPSERTYDLPPMWDGRRVEWRGWHSQDGTHVCPPRPNACEVCGSTAEQRVNVGTVHPIEGDTFDSLIERRTPSGGMYLRGREVPAWPIIRLVAFRCPDCGSDLVSDAGTEWTEWSWWRLDESDYGANGSNAEVS